MTARRWVHTSGSSDLNATMFAHNTVFVRELGSKDEVRRCEGNGASHGLAMMRHMTSMLRLTGMQRQCLNTSVDPQMSDFRGGNRIGLSAGGVVSILAHFLAQRWCSSFSTAVHYRWLHNDTSLLSANSVTASFWATGTALTLSPGVAPSTPGCPRAPRDDMSTLSGILGMCCGCMCVMLRWLNEYAAA